MNRSQYGERTISGLNKADFDEVNISKEQGALTFGNEGGTPHQVLQLDTSSEPSWKDITIGTGVITGGNLAPNISISTTGNIETTGTGTITSTGDLTFTSKIQSLSATTTSAIIKKLTITPTTITGYATDLILRRDTASFERMFEISNSLQQINSGLNFYFDKLDATTIAEVITEDLTESFKVFHNGTTNELLLVDCNSGIITCKDVGGNTHFTFNTATGVVAIDDTLDCENINYSGGDTINIFNQIETEFALKSVAEAVIAGGVKRFSLVVNTGNIVGYGSLWTLKSNLAIPVDTIIIDGSTGDITSVGVKVSGLLECIPTALNGSPFWSMNGVNGNVVSYADSYWYNNHLTPSIQAHIEGSTGYITCNKMITDAIEATIGSPNISITSPISSSEDITTSGDITCDKLTGSVDLHYTDNTESYCILSITYAAEGEATLETNLVSVDKHQFSYLSGCFIPEQPYQLNQFWTDDTGAESTYAYSNTRDSQTLAPYAVARGGGGTSGTDGFAGKPYLELCCNGIGSDSPESFVSFISKFIPYPNFFENIKSIGFDYILGDNTNGGYLNTLSAGAFAVYLCWNDGTGTFTNAGTFSYPATSGYSSGTYFTQLFHSTDFATSWTAKQLDLTDLSNLSAVGLTALKSANRFSILIMGYSNQSASRDVVAGITNIGFFATEYAKPAYANSGWSAGGTLNEYGRINRNDLQLLGNSVVSCNTNQLEYTNGYFWDWLDLSKARTGDSYALVENTIVPASSGDTLATDTSTAIGISSSGTHIVFDYKVPAGYRAVAYQIIMTGGEGNTEDEFHNLAFNSNLHTYCVLRGQGSTGLSGNTNQIISMGTDLNGLPIAVLSGQTAGMLASDLFSFCAFNNEVPLRNCKIGNSLAETLTEGRNWFDTTGGLNTPNSNLTQDGMKGLGYFHTTTGDSLYDPSYTPKTNSLINGASTQVQTLSIFCVDISYTFAYSRIKGGYVKLVKDSVEWF